MGKRTVFEANGKVAHSARQAKRQRTDASHEQESPAGAFAEDEVTSARQLEKALVFDQGSASSLRSGLSLLKRFLDSILYSAEEHSLPRKRAILREYLDTQKEKDKDGRDTVLLPQFIQAWDYAAETNFEALLAQITANLALLFKVFATSDDFKPYGALLCKTVMQPSVARRLVRSLSAPTNKEQVILPALRLLIEITRFDGGEYARSVYTRRDFTLEPKILARNIGTWKDSQGQTALELQRKPSIRTTSVRYFLAHLRYQKERAKAELLSNKDVVRAVLDHLTTDPPFLIAEIFDVFRNHVFLDKTIPRQVKSRILNGRALSHIAALYRYEPLEGSLAEGEKAPDQVAHEFLCFVCTSWDYGVMRETQGFYPHANDDDNDAPMEDFADDDLGIDFSTGPQKPGPVRNFILADFLQTLRPYANTRHQELVIELFKACPELIHDYFHRKQDFNYDPNLTSTWIGFSAFLYQTIELPVPQYFGAKKGYREHPPPVPTTLQSIMPQPLTQQVLVKCLNSSSDLIQLFAVRVLVVAFHKLRSVLKELERARASRPLKSWTSMSNRLVNEFSQRCPPMKAAIIAFRQPAFQKGLKREAITRLLSLYYEVTPQLALEEKFDVSLPLCNALVQTEKSSHSAEDKAFCVMELEHWIKMARRSPAMRWWQKNKSLPYSSFATLLKLVATSAESELYSGIKSLLVAIVCDHDMLQMTTSPDALDALIASLGGSCSSSAPVMEFLDDCCARFVKQPIKYFDDLDALCAKISRLCPKNETFSPLLMTLVEQWPFKGGKAEKGNPAEPLAQWLSKLLYLLKLIGEDEAVLELVRDSLVASADVAYQEILKDSFLWKMSKEKAKEALKLATGADFSGSERSITSPVPPEEPEESANAPVAVDLELPPEEDEKHAGLNRWRKKALEESIEDGDIGDLVICLCSQHAEIRIQAVTSIRQLMSRLDRETGDLQQLYLLLGEVLESTESYTESKPFPYVGGVFAAHCVKVIADPTHFMFGKINTFLTNRPSWNVRNLPRKFSRNIINSEPDEDDSYHKEVDWFLDYLIDCLRTSEDMEIFRTNNIFERLLSYYASKSCAISAKGKVVRLLLRAAAVGGSTTLITRCGLVSWIRMMLVNRDHRHGTLRVLAARADGLCDREKVDDWSSGSMKEMVAAIEEVAVEVAIRARS
ncbi:hypothetical protein K458DRAFT_357328 [Lentithecium fluviatile CBS 122367]|uniref:Ribosome biogenesis protein Urb1 n=1 Tax=Lentithecium fluviatile CBS 122367 TaxID=1168545 RepID=A0A6G1JK38_9PLEO|nr:hypothetical protein K458DRAFT_357328 [Lentithecium fluviatile CBS 122367]